MKENEVELQAGCGATHRYCGEDIRISVPPKLQEHIILELKIAEGQYTTINLGTGVIRELANTVLEMYDKYHYYAGRIK